MKVIDKLWRKWRQTLCVPALEALILRDLKTTFKCLEWTSWSTRTSKSGSSRSILIHVWSSLVRSLERSSLRWSKTPSSTLLYMQTDARYHDTTSSKVLIKGNALLQGLIEGEQIRTGVWWASGESIRQLLSRAGSKTAGGIRRYFWGRRWKLAGRQVILFFWKKIMKKMSSATINRF